MKIKTIPGSFSVCKVSSTDNINFTQDFCFVGKTDEEISLVCKTDAVPTDAIEKEDGFRGVRIEGVLDFSLIGILSKIANILAQNEIGIFVVSTYNTDYVLVKEENFEKALLLLEENGYEVADEDFQGEGNEITQTACIARITRMERYLDELTDVLQTDPERLSEDPEIKQKLQVLTDYYENGQWMKDYEADEKGELPKELKRGVLSEDAVYNLLFEIEQYRNISNSNL